jgi:NADH:ubiquinone oxidoreductase subunit 5 (subunit L)/multisubunit Na+/H+ antiporter MnhA subunit
MGGLIRFMPFTYTVMLIGTIALLGLPWLSGFYSKDLILELAFGNYQFSSLFAYILGTITAFLTAFYSTRLINLVYLTNPNANKRSYLNIHSENYIVIIPLSVLALFAIFLGFIASDFVGLGSDFFQNSLFYKPSQIHIIEAEFSLPLYIKLMPTVLSVLGGVFAIYLYHYAFHFLSNWILPFLSKIDTSLPSLRQGNAHEMKETLFSLSKQNTLPLSTEGGSARTPLACFAEVGVSAPKENSSLVSGTLSGSSAFISLERQENVESFDVAIKKRLKMQNIIVSIYTFLNGKYLLDILYNNYLISGGLKIGFTISKLLDKGFIELIGPFGLTEGSYSASYNISKLDTGVITTYALYITLGLISILLILFSPMLI